MNKLVFTNALFSHFPAAMDVIMNLRFLSLLGRKEQEVVLMSILYIHMQKESLLCRCFLQV